MKPCTPHSSSQSLPSLRVAQADVESGSVQAGAFENSDDFVRGANVVACAVGDSIGLHAHQGTMVLTINCFGPWIDFDGESPWGCGDIQGQGRTKPTFKSNAADLAQSQSPLHVSSAAKTLTPHINVSSGQRALRNPAIHGLNYAPG